MNHRVWGWGPPASPLRTMEVPMTDKSVTDDERFYIVVYWVLMTLFGWCIGWSLGLML